MRALIAAVMTSAVLAFPVAAAAQSSEADKAAARELAKDAAAALDGKQYKVAAEKFRKADELFHAPTLVLGLARAYVGIGKFVEAKEAYNRIIHEKLAEHANELFVQAVEEATREIQGLEAKIGWATINVIGADPLPDGLQARLDGTDLKAASFGVKRPLNPGQHQLLVSAPGFKNIDKPFEVRAQDMTTVEAKLEPGPGGTALPPPTGVAVDLGGGKGNGKTGGDQGGANKGAGQRIAGFALIGVGAAGLVVGGITGGLAIGKHGALKSECNADGSCNFAGAQDKISAYETIGTVSTIGFIAGGVLAGAGVVVLLTAPGVLGSNKTGGTPTLTLGATGATARWQF